MIETPERIWGHIDGDKGSWGRNWVFDEDVEYIRADLVEELEAKLAKAKDAVMADTPSPEAIMLAALADHIESMPQEEFLEWALAVDKALETHSPAKCAEAIRSLAELKGEDRG